MGKGYIEEEKIQLFSGKIEIVTVLWYDKDK